LKYSVCIATYNGVAFLEEQLDSILSEFDSSEDKYEIIIVDDFSSDNTVDLIKSYNNKNIKIFLNDRNMGHVKSFERSLKESTGDYIFLSDQDDIWVPGRVKLMVDELSKSNCEILFSGFSYIDKSGVQSTLNGNAYAIPPLNSSFTNILSIILGKADYWGCTALLTKSSLDSILPFDQSVEAHDHWIATVGIVEGKVHSISEATLLHRIHGKNVTSTKNRTLLKKLKTRFIMLKCLFYVVLRS